MAELAWLMLEAMAEEIDEASEMGQTVVVTAMVFV